MTSNQNSYKNNILELDKRKKIYNLVRKYAGSHFREIERISKMPSSSVKYHLDYLNKYGLIREMKKGNNLCYYPNDFNSDNQVLLAMLRQDSVRKILLLLVENKKCSHEEITRFVGLSGSTISWHLKKLVEKDIIKFHKDGRKSVYNLKVDEREIIEFILKYKNSFLDVLVNRMVEVWDI